MHRAAFATAESIGPAQHLTKTTVERSTHGQNGTVPAIGASHGVTRTKGAANAHHDRLLALAQVRAASDQVLAEKVFDLILEIADSKHLSQQLFKVIR
jgi:hypothetical protein